MASTTLIGASTRPAMTNPAAAFSVPGFSQSKAPAALTQAPSPLKPLAVTDQVNPGYGVQALNLTQNRLLEDPFAGTQANLAGQAQQPSAGQNQLDKNLGSLDGPGNGQQVWNQVAGQYQDPFAGEQFSRQSTAGYSPSGPASAFNSQAQGQYDNFTGYTGPGNAQGQYGQSQQQIGNGTQGQNNMADIASGYGSNGQYTGANLAAGQYSQTQGAFGDMPLPDSADPYYDRAIQLGTQTYNQGAAGRGVYGSSEALSGVGNVITDLNAKRAQTAFGNQMAITQEQRARQELLGNQARMGDLSGTDAFAANMKGVETYGNLNNQMGQLQNESMSILGNQANAADSQALGAQNSNIAGLNALGSAAQNADSAEARRFEGSNAAMNAADRTQIDRTKMGADIADMADDNEREDFRASTDAADRANDNRDQGLATASSIAHTGSSDDLAHVNSFNSTAQGAEGQRQTQAQAQLDDMFRRDKVVADMVGKAMEGMDAAAQTDFENWATSELAPIMNDANLSAQDKQAKINALIEGYRQVAS
jgi:hypothetical protein